MPTQSVRIPTGDGDLSAYLAFPEPSDTPRPGVIVLHEIFGLNEDIRRIARRFAITLCGARARYVFGGTATASALRAADDAHAGRRRRSSVRRH